MAWYVKPSHRNTEDEQPEVCCLCGNLVGHKHLRVGEVEGLRGFRICDLHPFEVAAMGRPSWADMRRLTPPIQAPLAGQRLPPIGAELWFKPEEDE